MQRAWISRCPSIPDPRGAAPCILPEHAIIGEQVSLSRFWHVLIRVAAGSLSSSRSSQWIADRHWRKCCGRGRRIGCLPPELASGCSAYSHDGDLTPWGNAESFRHLADSPPPGETFRSMACSSGDCRQAAVRAHPDPPIALDVRVACRRVAHPPHPSSSAGVTSSSPAGLIFRISASSRACRR